jgi:signal transduction histidine kinase
MIKNEGLRQLFIEGILQEFKHKNYREAQKLYKRCSVGTKNNRLKPFFFNGIARCYFKQGQVKKSIRLYQMIRNQYLSLLVKDSEILLYRVFRQLALCFNLINDKGTAWIKYFSLYQRIFKTRDPDDQLLALFKNEALDFILRHNPPDFPVFLGDDFKQLYQQVKKQPQTPLDRRLKKTYSGLKGIQWDRQMVEIPREIKNIIDRYNQELTLCRALEAYPDWERLNPSKGEVQSIKGNRGNRSFPVALSKGESGYTFGFLINPEFFKGRIFLNTDKQLAEDTGTKLFVKAGPPDPDFKHTLQTLSMAPLFPEEILILAAKKRGYYQDRVRRDVWISYGLIALLILTFILGIFLLHKYLSREAELVRLKSNFVDGVSHTLKTPLTRLSLLAEAVQEGCVQDEKKRERFFNIVISETIRMNEIINNLLNFSKVESGKKIYQPESLLFQQVVLHIIEQGTSSLQNLGFDLEKEIDMKLPAVHLDREAAKLIVLNLLQNAIKYSVDEKFIRVRLFMDGSNVCLMVEDRGLGISRKHLSRIFEKFYRETDKQVQALEGSGLGLFLVHHAVNAHSGDIQVSSQKGEGSVFTVSFPIKGNPDG